MWFCVNCRKKIENNINIELNIENPSPRKRYGREMLNRRREKIIHEKMAVSCLNTEIKLLSQLYNKET